MEKLIYLVWKPTDTEVDGFRDVLLNDLAPALLAQSNTRGLRIAVADSAVAAAGPRRMDSYGSLPDGLVSVWVDNAGARQDLEQQLGKTVDRFSAYLVTEAEPLVNTQYPELGQRTPGMCQVVFLQRPPRLSEQAWLSIWQGSHTQIAIATQSTFAYRQNVIVRAMSDDALPFSAMIEENFPEAAMASDQAFYAAGNEAELQTNMQAMLESCARFIDFDKIDVIPMSEYLIQPVGA
jgi:hypothetical protein